MILDIDLGNTRLKWREKKSTGSRAQSFAVPWRKGTHIPILNLEASPDRIRVSNVRGPDAEVAIVAWARARFGIEPEFARSTPCAAGVNNGYHAYAALGVDRWLAVIAAFDRLKSALVVFDFGSAITADAVSEDGCHLGGFIAPGLVMMQGSLLAGTDLVRFAGQGKGTLQPASDTRSAVENGVLAAAVGFTEQVWQHLGRATAARCAILTGGDAPVIASHLSIPLTIEPDLVLDGLALALP